MILSIEIVMYYDRVLPAFARYCINETIERLPDGWTFKLITGKINSPMVINGIKEQSAYFRVKYLSEHPESMWLDWDCYPLINLSTIDFSGGHPFCQPLSMFCAASALFPNGNTEIMRRLADTFRPEQFCICGEIIKSKLFDCFPYGAFRHLTKSEKGK